MNRPDARTLQRALDLVGSRELLATKLSIAAQDLDDYLNARRPIPNEVFLAALDVVAGKP